MWAHPRGLKMNFSYMWNHFRITDLHAATDAKHVQKKKVMYLWGIPSDELKICHYATFFKKGDMYPQFSWTFGRFGPTAAHRALRLQFIPQTAAACVRYQVWLALQAACTDSSTRQDDRSCLLRWQKASLCLQLLQEDPWWPQETWHLTCRGWRFLSLVSCYRPIMHPRNKLNSTMLKLQMVEQK